MTIQRRSDEQPRTRRRRAVTIAASAASLQRVEAGGGLAGPTAGEARSSSGGMPCKAAAPDRRAYLEQPVETSHMLPCRDGRPHRHSTSQPGRRRGRWGSITSPVALPLRRLVQPLELEIPPSSSPSRWSKRIAPPSARTAHRRRRECDPKTRRPDPAKRKAAGFAADGLRGDSCFCPPEAGRRTQHSTRR